MSVTLRRSALYMPATNERAVAKAPGLPCDAVILDLEDAVAPEFKAEARAAALGYVASGQFAGRDLVVRVNGLDTPWGKDDLEAFAANPPMAILLPKVADAATLEQARAILGEGPELWAMIETPLAILNIQSIAAAASATGLTTFIAGTNDLVKDLQSEAGPDRAYVLPHLMQMVLAARAYGICVLDGVSNAFNDLDVFAAECRQGSALGFDGKSLIHPRQIEPANEAFSPSQEAVAWARTIVEAFAQPENSGKGAIRIDGRMVELLHASEAESLLERAKACGVA